MPLRILALFLLHKTGMLEFREQMERIQAMDQDDPEVFLKAVELIESTARRGASNLLTTYIFARAGLGATPLQLAGFMRDYYEKGKPYHARAEQLYYLLARHRQDVGKFEYTDAFRRIYARVIRPFLETNAMRYLVGKQPAAAQAKPGQPATVSESPDTMLEMWAKGDEKVSFVLLWGYFYERIMAEHDALHGRLAPAPLPALVAASWIELMVRKAAAVRAEEIRMARSGQRFLPNPDCGYFFAAVHKLGAERLPGYDDDRFFEAAAMLLAQEGASSEQESQYFTPEARHAVELARHFIEGKLPWGELVQKRGVTPATNHYALIHLFDRNGARMEAEFRRFQEQCRLAFLARSHSNATEVSQLLVRLHASPSPDSGEWCRLWDREFEKFNAVYRSSFGDLNSMVVFV